MTEVDKEREAIVAWLRGNAAAQKRNARVSAHFGNYEIAREANAAAARDHETADAIERLAHHKGKHHAG